LLEKRPWKSILLIQGLFDFLGEGEVLSNTNLMGVYATYRKNMKGEMTA